MKKYKWLWEEIEYGYDENFLNEQDIKKYAWVILDDDINSFDDVLEIAIMGQYDDPVPKMRMLSERESVKSKEEIKMKWLIVFLHHVYENREKYADVWQIVDSLYADFDYPECMRQFVSYMPSSEPGTSDLTREQNKERMLSRLFPFLQTKYI